MVIAGKKCPHPLLLKAYGFNEPKHYLSCIFNGLRLSREDQGIYPEYLHLSRISILYDEYDELGRGKDEKR
jgi:hypothetical protein